MNGRDNSTIQRDKFTLQHKHFCFIASVLKDSKPAPHWDANKHAQWQSIVHEFMAECKRHNSKFNADRFLEACGHE
jgi:hypothetical protein